MILAPVPQAVAPLLANADFSHGLSGWKTEGNAHVLNGALTLGPGRCAVRRRYVVPGLRILWFGARVKPSGTEVKAGVRLECFDAKGRSLMDLRAATSLKSDFPAIYMKTQARTASVVLSIEKTGDEGTAVADDALLKDDDRVRVEHAPQVDLVAAMKPIWKGNEIVDESLLLLARGDGPPTGRLMFPPVGAVTVRDFTREYADRRDFILSGDTLTAVKGSAIPTMRDSEFARGEFPWTNLQGRHVFVTYRHDRPWKGPIPQPQGARLPRTLAKLKAEKPVTIVAYGDSITQGLNVSGFRNVPPYLPPWPTLAARELARLYGNARIRLINAALGGQTSYWARDNAKDAVATLDPDLVIVAFGMNDFWSLTPDEFAKNIESTLATIRARRPTCEFVLVTSMRFDPAYTADPSYLAHFDGYAAALRRMVGPGVALLDMTLFSEALYQAKSAKDLATDPMHPNDFLSRWYAQSLVETLAPKRP